tara:strand:- start:168 stop:1148 length:981 start_codon:yes stop_codon:yes gene_type:complete
MVQTEDGALIEVTNMLQRMRELAVQSSTGTNSSTDRTALNTEFKALANQVEMVGQDTAWGGSPILRGYGAGDFQSFQVGANAAQTIDHTFNNLKLFNPRALTETLGSRTDATGSASSRYEAIAFDTGDSFTIKEGDTLSFFVDDVGFAADVTSVVGGQITGVTMHGSSSEIGSSHVIIGSNSVVGDFTLAIDSPDSAQIRGTTVTAGADFVVSGLIVVRGSVAATQYMDLLTADGASNTISSMDHVLDKVNSARAASGATINRLEHAVDNLSNVSQNTSASRSRILDADYAAETAELARTQIVQQAGTAMLTQANQRANSILAFLK